MNEVEMMYSNAGLEPTLFYDCESYNQKVEKGYLFTAEKRLSLIKWLSEQYTITTRYMASAWFITAETSDVTRTVIKYTVTANTFEEAIASAINHIWFWQDLTEEECKQIRNILESEVRE